jgi:hypothetical protein
MNPIARTLVAVGVALVLAGVLWQVGARLRLGRLPGDVVVEREGFRLYIPIVTCIAISVVVSLALYLLGVLRGRGT